MARLSYHHTDIFQSFAVIVCPVNCTANIEQGSVAILKENFPALYQKYRHDCRQGLLQVGQVQVYGNILCTTIVAQAGDIATLEDIGRCLYNIRNYVQKNSVSHLAIPALGCDMGLAWSQVQPLILRYLDVKLEIYLPR